MGFSSFLIVLAAVNLSFGTTVAVEVTAKLGEDAVLPCPIYENRDVDKLWWSRLEPKIRLLEFENGKIKMKHANYTNRIYLQKPKLEGRNYNLVLKNVTKKDDGRYECQTVYETQHSATSGFYDFRFKVVSSGGSGSPVKLFLPALMFSLLMGMILL